MITLLSSSGASVDAANIRGETPLIVAIREGNNDVARELVKAILFHWPRKIFLRTCLFYFSWCKAQTTVLKTRGETRHFPRRWKMETKEDSR